MLYINGEWRTARSGRTFESRNPATGEVIDSVADAGVAGTACYQCMRRVCIQVKRNWAAGLAGAAGDLGLSELETLREIDAHAMLGPCHRVADRFAVRSNDAGDLDPRPPSLEIPFELDLGKQRIFD